MTTTETRATLRPSRDSDRELLLAVYGSTRADELDLVAWPPGGREAFVEMQFSAQDHEYRRLNPKGSFDVIEVDGEGAGRLYVDRRPGDLRIIDIALLPQYRGRGIGGRLIRALQREAAAGGCIVSLHVEATNRAAGLYERLGFVVVEDQGIHRRMEWAP